MRAGVVGYQLPSLRVSSLPLDAGDVMVLATDGLRSDLAAEASPLKSPRANADHLFAWGHKGTDDALVLVARFQGPPA
jgi:negative regulator of sigma-B (phosphoserine phosphatase)